MSGELFSSLFAQIGFGGVIGFVVGYACKILLKVFVIMIGLFFLILLYLSYAGFIEINYEKVLSFTQGVFNSITLSEINLPTFLIANIPFAGSFVVGFILGLKVG